ncbi:TolC family protein [Stenotrophomonas maltophilia]|uniref:efflux transporter outer membrane subunit n=1 Tax=Stenotrophomonas TaxID=40323 RepID=UPI0018D3EE90|nr:TolC family protein [Stenotrophomonas maltophilia]MBH1816827.1 TolC family protein [Stenotrophomonas maltophilia]MCU1029712.1 TolC family protein [Stenotrophomonas maltophilia]
MTISAPGPHKSSSRKPRRPRLALALLPIVAALAACTTLEPAYKRPPSELPETWSNGHAAGAHVPPTEGWGKLVADNRLRQVLVLTKQNSEDIALAALRIERARQQYRISGSQAMPTGDATVSQSRTENRSSSQPFASSATASVGITSYELDLFGKVRSMKRQALQLLLANQQSKRAIENAALGDSIKRYLTLAANQDLLLIAQSTLQSREEAVRILAARTRAGEGSPLDLARAETELAVAQEEHVTALTELELAKNALNTTVGTVVPDTLLPTPGTLNALLDQRPPPTGLSSEVLLARPDVAAAEAELKAANANVGVARAALFPSIRLTAALGGASDQLTHLFSDGGRYWNLLPSATIPLFDGGARKANVAVSVVDRDIAAVRYRDALHDAFYQVADALSLDSTALERIALLRARQDAAQKALNLVNKHYTAGIAAYIDVLDAQRTANQADRTLTERCLSREINRVSLFIALGNGMRGEGEHQ